MQTPKEKIVVIGAGLAGLTIAYRLYQKGYDVEVYEARPRVGGRVHTVLIQNREGNYSTAELGAQNITDGGNATNLLSLTKELEIDIVEHYNEFEGSFYDGDAFHDKQTVFSNTSIKREDLPKKLEEARKTSRSMLEVLNQMVGEQSIQKRMLTYLLNAYEGLPPQLLSAQPHNLSTLEHMMLGGLSQVHQATEQTSVLHLMSLKEGNATLPMKLGEKLSGRVHLNKVLKQVAHINKTEIQLTFEDGTSIRCDKLIIAIPCSVYSDIHFDEKLIDVEKLKRFQTIHYGINAKAFVPIKDIGISFSKTWTFTDTVSASINFDQKLLSMYFVNDNGSNLFEGNEFDKALTMAKIRFKNASFNENTPIEVQDLNFVKTDSSVVKSWVKDIYAKGSFSTYDVVLQDRLDQKMHYNGIEVKKIFLPIENRIFFVGEHTTILDETGTMEAAVESGERIAKLF